MSERDPDFRPRDEPVAVHPALRPFVEAARNQAIVSPQLRAEDIQMAWAQRQRERKQSRRSLALGCAIGFLAAAVVAAIALPQVLDSSEPAPKTEGIVTHSSEPADPTPPEADEVERDAEPEPAEGPWQLSPAIRLRTDPQAQPPQVLAAWTIALTEGEHEIELDEGAEQPLLLVLPDRRLELVHGTVRVELADGETVVHLEQGVAAWVSEDGVRTDISVERIDLDEPQGERAPSAAELARDIEAKLAAGQRDAARTGLRQLLKKYPRSSQARTGLLDLALLERSSGNRDNARCAYLLYLQRWPDSNLRGEVETQLARLGEGSACKGLDPK